MFLTKLQKRQIPEKGFALLKNDITKNLKHKKTFDKLQIFKGRIVERKHMVLPYSLVREDSLLLTSSWYG